MKNEPIIWFIEHISRELDVACAVAVLFKKKYGIKITILPYIQDIASDYLKLVLPKIIILPYCYSLNDQMLSVILPKFPNAIYFNMAWEQIFYKANLDYKTPQDVFAKKYVFHHSWSQARSEFLQKKGIPKKNIFVNGHPAYQLYKNPYKKIFQNRSVLSKEFKLDQKKKWIFFPENYSWFFYSDHQMEKIIKNGQDRETAYLMRDYCGKALIEVLKWLRAVNADLKNIEIILRPRPAFSLAYFTSIIEKLSPGINTKINIIKDYSVREWILASDLVMSSFSTSLIEAAIAEKPNFMLDPLKLPNALSAPWYQFVKKIKTQAQFVKLCKKIPYQKPGRLKTWAVRNFFVNDDPITGLVNYLARLYFTQKPAVNLQDRLKFENITKSKTFLRLITNYLGFVKRKILGQQAYYINDDRKKYLLEIKKKYAVFEKKLKGRRLKE